MCLQKWFPETENLLINQLVSNWFIKLLQTNTPFLFYSCSYFFIYFIFCFTTLYTIMHDVGFDLSTSSRGYACFLLHLPLTDLYSISLPS